MRRGKRQTQKLIIAILLMTFAIGFAALSSNIKISGLYNVKSMRWNVYWNNPQLVSSNVSTSTPTISNGGTTVNYSISFTQPGDYYEFTIDAVNEGTLDAILDSFENKAYASDGTTEIAFPSYIKYSLINNSDNTNVRRGQELAHNQTKTYKFRVEFMKDIEISQLPSTSATTMNLELSSTYVQKTDEAVNSYAYYDGYATEDDVNPEVFTYEITDSTSHKASITGFNGDYKATSNTAILVQDFSISSCDDYSNFIGSDVEDCNVEHNIFPELRKTVIPAKVKLNSSGEYSKNGTEYTITSVNISNGDEYSVNNAIEELIIPNTVTDLVLSSTGYDRLKLLKLSNNLSNTPYVEIGSSNPSETNIIMPSGITSISPVDENHIRFSAQGEANKINLYIPSTITTIEDYAIDYSAVKNIYIEDYSVKSKVVSAITSYCSDDSSCISNYSARIKIDQTKF